MNNSIFTRTLATLSLVVALAGIAPTASADEAKVSANRDLVVNHIRVSYADLNLSSEDGARALVSRLASASIEACGGRPASGPGLLYVSAKSKFDACRKTAIANAVHTVDRPTVTAAFNGKFATDNRTASR